MKVNLWLGVFSFWMLAGCGSPRLVQHSTTTSDSTKIKTEKETVRTDSSFFRKEQIKRTIEGSTVEGVYSKAQLDSLIAGLQKMPSASRNVYMTDPKMQTTLAIVLDSLGKIHFKCTVAERTYYEASIEQGRVIENSTRALVERDRAIKVLEETVKQYQQAWYVKLGNFFKNSLLLVLLIASVVAIVIFKLRR